MLSVLSRPLLASLQLPHSLQKLTAIKVRLDRFLDAVAALFPLRILENRTERAIRALLSAVSEKRAGIAPPPKQPRKRAKAQRLRNRNRFIDTFLRDEKGGDDYADLEDWIVADDAADYEAVRFFVKDL